MSKIIELGTIVTLLGLSEEDSRNKALTQVGMEMSPHWLEASPEERQQVVEDAKKGLEFLTEVLDNFEVED